MKKSITTRVGGTIPCHEPRPAREVVLAVATWPVSVMNNMLRWLERDRQRRHLYGLSHHMLKDIGLSRADVDFEFRKLPWHE